MLLNDEEIIDSLNDNGEDDNSSDQDEEQDINSIDDMETLRSIIAKKDETIANNEASKRKLYARLKKEQGFIQDDDGNWIKKDKKTESKTEKKAAKEDISITDAMVLIKSNVTEEEDINQVKDYARLKGVSIAEALKAPIMKTILAELAENRAVALATHTGSARKTKTQGSDEVILEHASQGKLPDDPEALAKARFQTKFNKK